MSNRTYFGRCANKDHLADLVIAGIKDNFNNHVKTSEADSLENVRVGKRIYSVMTVKNVRYFGCYVMTFLPHGDSYHAYEASVDFSKTTQRNIPAEFLMYYKI